MARNTSSKIPLEEVYDLVGDQLPKWQKLFDPHFRRGRLGELEERLRESEQNRLFRLDAWLDDDLYDILDDFVQQYSLVDEESFEGPSWRFGNLALGILDEYDLAGHVHAALEFQNELRKIDYLDPPNVWEARNVDQTIAEVQRRWTDLIDEYAAYNVLQKLPREKFQCSKGGRANAERLEAENEARNTALKAAASKLGKKGMEPHNIASALEGQLQRQEIRFVDPTTGREEPIDAIGTKQIRRILA